MLSPRRGSAALDVGRKAFQHGTHRLVAPAETVARLRPLLPALGITRLANVTGLDAIGIPVAVACRPNSRSVAVSNGKGVDLAAAEASALMESVEGYHAERISLPLRLGRYAELCATERLVDPSTLPRPTTSRYHPDLPLFWLEGHDLLHDAPTLVPYDVVHTDFTLPLVQGDCFTLTANGLASGNHWLEAISHGICEVVERDALTLWEVSDEAAQRAARLDLATVDDPVCSAVLAKYERARVEVAVFEITSDMGIPAFLCTIAEREYDPLRPLYGSEGSGCHPVREIALLRALTEAAQSRLAIIAGSRDDIGADDYAYLCSPTAERRFRARLAAGPAARDFRAIPTAPADTFAADVAWELERLRAVGVDQVVVVDLTRPEFELPVVRVVIPGLEGLHAAPDYRLGPRASARLAGRA
jgi:ribosomal protein S12 methylthiotransferase accessory factor